MAGLGKKLVIMINSPGGLVTDGFYLKQRLAELQKKQPVNVEAKVISTGVASLASLPKDFFERQGRAFEKSAEAFRHAAKVMVQMSRVEIRKIKRALYGPHRQPFPKPVLSGEVKSLLIKKFVRDEKRRNKNNRAKR